jgi:hypothetical protein
LESLLPISGSKFENAAGGPARQQAKKVSQISKRLNRMELSTSQKRNKTGVDFATFVVSNKNPILL